MIKEHRFPSLAPLIEVLAARCSELITAQVPQHPAQSVLLSGGNTPRPLYEKLASSALPWKQIHLALIDERWVPPSHAASNEGMLRAAFNTVPTSSFNFTGMYSAKGSANTVSAEISKRYQALPKPWTFALLGMGADGHTASLFPGAAGLDEAIDSQALCAPVLAVPSPVTGEHVQRMTLTLHGLLQAEQLILLITGDDKWQVYQQALTSATPQKTPISFVLQQNLVPIEVYWCP